MTSPRSCWLSGILVAALGAGVCGHAPAVAQDRTRLGAAVQPFVVHDAPVVALVGATLVDGTGRPARRDQTIVLVEGRIAAVGDRAGTEVPSGAQVIEVGGLTVLPGLVMVHEHLFYPVGRTDGVLHYVSQIQSFPRLYLAAGVTTLRTAGALEGYAEMSLARDIDAGRRVGPRIHITAPFIDRAGTGILQVNSIRSPDTARRMVGYWADEGATWFKVYNYLTRAELSAVVSEAHARGLKVTGHLCSITASEAIELGIDNIEHGLMQMADVVPGKQVDTCPGDAAVYAAVAAADVLGPQVQEIIRRLIDAGVAITSTLPIFETVVPGRPPASLPALASMSDAARAEYLQSRARFAESKDSTLARAFRNEMRFERAFVDAGGLLVAGSDPTGYGGTVAGFGNHREIELLVEAGFTTEQAVRIASLNGAKLLGVDGELGSVEVGKRADLVLVDGDPVGRIQDIRRVRWVFKDGVAFDAQLLVSSVRGWVGKY